MSSTLQIFLLAFLGSIIALAGGAIFLFNKTWSKRLEEHSVPFAAGVLLTVALLGLLPEAVHEIGEKAFLFVLLSFVSAYLFEHTFFQVHHHDHHIPGHTKSYNSAIPLIIIGDTIHNFIDGVAIASSFLVAPGLGLITAISTFLHEVPHEVSDFGLLLKAGWDKKRVLLVNVFSASLTIVGAFSVILFLQDGPAVGILLSISAGMFLYLGASDFLPHIDEGGKKPIVAIAPFLIGIIIMILTFSAVPHSRDNDTKLENNGRQEDTR
ncbi:ZIP family metal transporter [Patescibacteria group bacterium]|nr:ZIP family metal transporter [Patescibacteria group bacterium]